MNAVRENALTKPLTLYANLKILFFKKKSYMTENFVSCLWKSENSLDPVELELQIAVSFCVGTGI